MNSQKVTCLPISTEYPTYNDDFNILQVSLRLPFYKVNTDAEDAPLGSLASYKAGIRSIHPLFRHSVPQTASTIRS
jgi:hypothetical protein